MGIMRVPTASGLRRKEGKSWRSRVASRERRWRRTWRALAGAGELDRLRDGCSLSVMEMDRHVVGSAALRLGRCLTWRRLLCSWCSTMYQWCQGHRHRIPRLIAALCSLERAVEM